MQLIEGKRGGGRFRNLSFDFDACLFCLSGLEREKKENQKNAFSQLIMNGETIFLNTKKYTQLTLLTVLFLSLTNNMFALVNRKL